ncbi:MAG: hypothetical protein U9R34_01775 [Nanoarchaeota archaeon]|nr:hypothetical protein [Nanoarchaeota archaeon]
MREFMQLQHEAVSKIKLAEHMLTQTYPLIKDPKLLLAVVKDVSSALDGSMSSLLNLELKYKKIPVFENTFEGKYNAFRYHVIDRCNINREFLLLIKDVQAIIIAHNKSPVEFARKGKFVICATNYSMQEITPDKLRRYINQTKEFISIINNVVNKYGRII